MGCQEPVTSETLILFYLSKMTFYRRLEGNSLIYHGIFVKHEKKKKTSGTKRRILFHFYYCS